MAYSGGDTPEITCNHPTLGMFSFEGYGGEDWTYNKSNKVADDDDAAIGANGTFIDKRTSTRDSVSGPVAGSPGDNTFENLVLLQSDTVLGVWTVANANGSVYKLTGKPVGQIAMSAMDSKIALKIAGSNLQIL